MQLLEEGNIPWSPHDTDDGHILHQQEKTCGRTTHDDTSSSDRGVCMYDGGGNVHVSISEDNSSPDTLTHVLCLSKAL